MSDTRGGIHCADGIDPADAHRHKRETGSLNGLAGCQAVTNEELLTLPCDILISRGQVVKRALVREVEQHIRRALLTLASPTTPAEQEEIDGFCKVLGLGDDWNYTPR